MVCEQPVDKVKNQVKALGENLTLRLLKCHHREVPDGMGASCLQVQHSFVMVCYQYFLYHVCRHVGAGPGPSLLQRVLQDTCNILTAIMYRVEVMIVLR